MEMVQVGHIGIYEYTKTKLSQWVGIIPADDLVM